jgi:hypothetical protein
VTTPHSENHGATHRRVQASRAVRPSAR